MSPPWSCGAISRRGDGRRSRSIVAVAAAVILCVTLGAGCGMQGKRGIELGHLRDLARRVDGGGAECPLSVPSRYLRPSTVDRDAPIVPLRDDGPGSDGVVGYGLPTKDSVRITCRYRVDDVGVTLVVVGVTDGHAIAEFGNELKERGDGSMVLTFIDVNGELPVGRARALPGEPPAAFTRVASTGGDVALVLGVDRLDDDAELPPASEVEGDAVEIAQALAD